MTQREAKRRAVQWVADVLAGDWPCHCIYNEDDNTERSDDDVDRMVKAFEDLRLELVRRLCCKV